MKAQMKVQKKHDEQWRASNGLIAALYRLEILTYEEWDTMWYAVYKEICYNMTGDIIGATL